jgi:acetyltransferase-like isoleucine patch superfamily enzyme
MEILGKIISHILNKYRIQNTKHKISTCGTNVSIPASVLLFGNRLRIGNNVYLGEDDIFMCSRADIQIGDNVMFGPRVTLVTGDHRINVIGKYMVSIKDNEKEADNDLPIIIEGDNWIGAHVLILKGVTVGEGSVIAGGSVVTRDVPEYSIVAGNPAKVIKKRFSEEEILLHKTLLKKELRNDYADNKMDT